MEKVDIGINKDNFGINKIKLYKDIFGEEPWNEGFICKNCDKIYPKKFMGKCNCGNPKLEAFYNNLELKYSFKELSLKEGYKEYIAKILGNEIGFIWGWNTNLITINSEKLGLDNSKYNILESSISSIYHDFTFEKFYYLSEIGVKHEFRGHSVASSLYRNTLDNIKDVNFVLLRTTKKSDLPYKWFIKEGFLEVFQYNDSQDRVILIKKL